MNTRSSKARGRGWRASALAVAVSGAFGVAGCGGNDTGSNATGTQTVAARQAGTATKFPKLQTPSGTNDASGLTGKTVGLVVITQASEVFPQMQASLKEAFSKLGWTMKLSDLQGDISTVPAVVSNLLQGGVDAIVLQSVEPSFVGKQAAAQAKAKGVPIIGSSTGVPTAKSNGIIDGAVEAPFQPPGVEEGKAMLEAHGADAKVAFVIDQLASSGKAAQKGAEEGLAGQMKVVAKHQLNYAKLVPDVAATTKQWLVQYPDLKAIWCPYDGACVGAGEAVKASGKDVAIWSMDGTPTAFKLIRAGVKYTTWAFPLDYMMWLTTDAIVSRLSGRPVDPSAESIPSFKIDKSNVPASGELSGTQLYGDFRAAFVKRWGVAG
jgi:ribose transport system substrate-binding protein